MQAQRSLSRNPSRGSLLALVMTAVVAFGIAAWIGLSVVRGSSVVVQSPAGAGVQSASSSSGPADGGCQWTDGRKAC
jgi:hypothetical protein